MAGGVLVVLEDSEAVRAALGRLADHRATGAIPEDDAPGLTLHFGATHWPVHAATHHAGRTHGFRAVHKPDGGELSLRAEADNSLAHGYHTLLDLTAWLLARVPTAVPSEALVWVEARTLPPDQFGYADFRWHPARRAWELIDGDDPSTG